MLHMPGGVCSCCFYCNQIYASTYRARTFRTFFHSDDTYRYVTPGGLRCFFLVNTLLLTNTSGKELKL
jgi:hypothetical protein